MGICSFPLSLKIAHIKDGLWVIRSRHPWKKSNHEQIALVALSKRATMSDSLRLLRTKERLWAIRSGHSWKKSSMSDSLMIWAKCSQKRAIRLEKILFFVVLGSFSLLYPYNAHERIAHVALHSVMTTERWEGFALFHEQNARKTNERIPNPDFQPCFRMELKMY